MNLVIDSNIFAKLFIHESDSEIANLFFSRCVSEDVTLLAPTLFEYELIQIALYYSYPIDKVLQQLALYQKFNLSLISPDKSVWLQSEVIVNDGHKNNGFPSLYDSVYHALAIKSGCNFVTADKRHKAKAKQFGHIVLLDQWEACW